MRRHPPRFREYPIVMAMRRKLDLGRHHRQTRPARAEALEARAAWNGGEAFYDALFSAHRAMHGARNAPAAQRRAGFGFDFIHKPSKDQEP